MTSASRPLDGELGRPRPEQRPLARWLALITILVVAAALRLYQLDREGWSNPYYAATVRSLLTSWHAFFFASFDPGGFVTVDKPPLGFWIQAASAWLLGYSGVSLLLPGALAGVLSVAILYRLVAGPFGVVAGLIAGAVLAVAPINVATDRNNTVDSVLVLVLLLAAWAISHSIRRGSLRWLLLGVVFVGLGFNIKMLQAYLVLPALFAFYAVSAGGSRWRRLAHLGIATAVLLVVSLAWVAAVDLVPQEQRPYVGGSQENSALELALGYNGLSRLLGMGGLMTAAPGGGGYGIGPGPGHLAAYGNAVVAVGGPAGGEAGEPGPFRLMNDQLFGQIGWLLVPAVVGLVVGLWQERRALSRRRPNERLGALVLWGGWLLTGAAFFGVASFWHPYYLVILSPAVAALVGAGCLALWRSYRNQAPIGWLLPSTIVAAAVLQARYLSLHADWNWWLTPLVLGGALVASVTLVVVRPRSPAGSAAFPAGVRVRSGAQVAGILALVALLAGPTVWAAIPVATAPGQTLPSAGPATMPDAGFAFAGQGGHLGTTDGPAPAGGMSTGQAITLPVVLMDDSSVDPELISYLRANRGGARFLVATEGTASASPIIIETGEPVMALGGFGGGDRIVSLAELQAMIEADEVRFFLLFGDVGPGPFLAGQSAVDLPAGDLGGWVREQCERVPPALWGSSNASEAGDDDQARLSPPRETLYDCAAAQR